VSKMHTNFWQTKSACIIELNDVSAVSSQLDQLHFIWPFVL